MISDRELSALVAENVYGFHLLKDDRTRMVRSLNAKGTAAGMYAESVPPFATDAGLALGAAMASNVTYEAHIHKTARGFLSFTPGSRGSIGTTAARSMCFAALRATGIEVKDDAEKKEGEEIE